MTRHALLFVVTFVLGALIALGTRTALHDPHAEHKEHTTPATVAPVSAPRSGTPVNTVCAICGMKVDPSVPTVVYQGKTIGFGCKMCPPKFKAEPDKYGPVYLRNEIIKR